MDLCGSCGAFTPVGAKFCAACGKRVIRDSRARRAPGGADPARGGIPPTRSGGGGRSAALPLAGDAPGLVSESGGQTMEADRTTRCPSCGLPVPSDFQFCGRCGASMAGRSQTAPAPRPRGQAKLLRLDTTGKPLETHKLDRSELTFGRGADLSFPADTLLSRRHARVFYNPSGGLSLEDLNSRNGTYVRVRKEADLRNGDHLLVGQIHFRFEVAATPAAGADPLIAEDVPAAGGFGPTAPFGGKDPRVAARLFRVLQSGGDGAVAMIGPAGLTIGREKGNLVFRKDTTLSREHARIVVADGGFRVKDLESRNGTYQRIRGIVDLLDGDVFRLGEQIFAVESA